MAAPALVTWEEVKPVAGGVVTLVGLLLGALWRQHQKEMDTLREDHKKDLESVKKSQADSTAQLTSQVKGLENDLDNFRETEIKQLKQELYARFDKMTDAIHQLGVNLASNFAKRDELERLRDELHRRP